MLFHSMAPCLGTVRVSKYHFMKKMILVLAVLAFTATLEKTTAQIRLNINIGAQPDWGPSGYDYVEYYYMPDMDVYYYVPKRQFVYLNGSRWVFVNTLPARYRSYNLYNSYKVVINEPRPYLNHAVYKAKYAGYKGSNGKQSLNKGNSKYNSYKGRGNSKSKGKSHGRN